MWIELVGAIGLLLLASAWIPQTWHTIKTRQHVDLHFNVMYVVGSLLLVVYSVALNNLIFIVLNIMAFCLATINLLYSIRRK